LSGPRLGIGLDVGSTTTKAVMVDPQGNILGSHLVPTAESEVIRRIGAGESPKDIAAGVHAGMASKIATISKRVGVVTPACVTGGVALNPAFRYYLSKQLGAELWTPDNPQLTGALGAALLSLAP